MAKTTAEMTAETTATAALEIEAAGKTSMAGRMASNGGNYGDGVVNGGNGGGCELLLGKLGLCCRQFQVHHLAFNIVL